MILNPGQTHVAYRCPDCGTIIYGFVGKFAHKMIHVQAKLKIAHFLFNLQNFF